MWAGCIAGGTCLGMWEGWGEARRDFQKTGGWPSCFVVYPLAFGIIGAVGGAIPPISLGVLYAGVAYNKYDEQGAKKD